MPGMYRTSLITVLLLLTQPAIIHRRILSPTLQISGKVWIYMCRTNQEWLEMIVCPPCKFISGARSGTFEALLLHTIM